MQSAERTYIAAADTPSYFQIIKRKTKDKKTKSVECSSNLDFGISRIQNTTVTVEPKHWEGISDHRPFIVKIPAKLSIKDVRKRISKALFHSPSTIQGITEKYRETIPDLTKILKEVEEETIEDDMRTALSAHRRRRCDRTHRKTVVVAPVYRRGATTKEESVQKVAQDTRPMELFGRRRR